MKFNHILLLILVLAINIANCVQTSVKSRTKVRSKSRSKTRTNLPMCPSQLYCGKYDKLPNSNYDRNHVFKTLKINLNKRNSILVYS